MTKVFEGYEDIAVVGNADFGAGLSFTAWVREPRDTDEAHSFAAIGGALWQKKDPTLFDGYGLRADRMVPEVRKHIRRSCGGMVIVDGLLPDGGALYWLLEPSDDDEAPLVWRWNEKAGDCPVKEVLP